jgi:hypothetical protein
MKNTPHSVAGHLLHEITEMKATYWNTSASALYDHLSPRNAGISASHSIEDITFTLRLCTCGDTFSGGMVLEARLNGLAGWAKRIVEPGYKPRQSRFRHTPFAKVRFKSVTRAVGKIMDWVEQDRELWVERAKLCKWGEGFDIPLDAELPEREQAFDSMTVEDIAFWREYLPGNFAKIKSDLLKQDSLV